MSSKEKPSISDVQVTQKGVRILIGKETFLLSINDYTSGFYYPDKTLSDGEYQELKRLSSLKKASDYVSSLLRRNRYSVKGIKEKIKTRFSISEKETDLLLQPYLDSQILDDVSYALDFAEIKSEAGYGRHYIESELKKKGIPDSILKKEELLSFYQESIKQLPCLIERKDKTLHSQTIEKRKATLLSFLIRRGYPTSQSKKAIDSFYSSLSREKEEEEKANRKVLLKKEAGKCYNALVRKNEPPQKKKESFFQKLRAKGFRYDEIEEIYKQEGYSFHD